MTAASAGWLVKLLSVLVVIAYPLILHQFVLKNASGVVGVGLSIIPLILGVLWQIRHSRHRMMLATGARLSLTRVPPIAGWPVLPAILSSITCLPKCGGKSIATPRWSLVEMHFACQSAR